MLLKPTKCLFLAAEMLYLGFIISTEGLKPEPAKLQMIADWPVPTTHAHISSFLGFTGYYRCFVPDYLMKMVVLHKEKKSVEKFNWTTECQTEFEMVRAEFAKNLYLVFPDFSKMFYLETDASKMGLGACLSQSYPVNEMSSRSYLHPIEFGSCTTNSAEKNYSVMELEAMAVIYALQKFYPVIAGAR